MLRASRERRFSECVVALPKDATSSTDAVACGSDDGIVRVWPLTEDAGVRDGRGHTPTVICLAALSGGYFVSGAHDSTIRLWSVATAVCARTLRGHDGPVTALAALPEAVALADALLAAALGAGGLRIGPLGGQERGRVPVHAH